MSDVSFLVDTGADKSVLLSNDGKRMGIDYTKLTEGDDLSIGIGGICSNYIEPALVVFSEPRRFLYVYKIKLEIAKPEQEIEILKAPSLLGRDILDRWRMIYDPTKKRLSFKVISADVTIPLST